MQDGKGKQGTLINIINPFRVICETFYILVVTGIKRNLDPSLYRSYRAFYWRRPYEGGANKSIVTNIACRSDS